jgi:hypothetical protein
MSASAATAALERCDEGDVKGALSGEATDGRDEGGRSERMLAQAAGSDRSSRFGTECELSKDDGVGGTSVGVVEVEGTDTFVGGL